MGVIFTILSEVSNHLPQHVMMGLDGWLRGGSVMFYATLAAGVILVGMGVAFIKIYNQYYGFTLMRVGQHLAIARGLFTKHTMQLRTTRVQAVQLEQSLLRRALHLQTVSVLLASANQSEKMTHIKTCSCPLSNLVKWPKLSTLSYQRYRYRH
ncbi:PH domain-containing protein [Leuconostoc holzapfelii]|nr:PH domain-containing protein [Leuconostoc holzapfelii]